MPAKIIPLPKVYLEKILKPVNRLTESCVLKTKGSSLYTICSSEDNSVILYAQTKIPLELDEDIRLNLISIKKLLSGLDCLGSDGEFSIKIGENSITCQIVSSDNEKTHFKYHLVDDSIVKESVLRIEKFAELSFDTEFMISANKAKQILSAASFASDVSKVYFSVLEDTLQAEINDHTLQNVDNITIPITTKWEGEVLDGTFPISLEIFKNLAAIKNDIKVKISNQFKVMLFNITEDDNLELKYVVSALIK